MNKMIIIGPYLLWFDLEMALKTESEPWVSWKADKHGLNFNIRIHKISSNSQIQCSSFESICKSDNKIQHALIEAEKIL